MGKVKGQIEYDKFKEGKPLTRKQAIRAYCYQCNGFVESRKDCDSKEICPLYEWNGYNHS